MRTLGKAALALGFVGALGLSAAAPAQAQFYFNAPGVHIGIGPPHRQLGATLLRLLRLLPWRLEFVERMRARLDGAGRSL
jgi:hypothetical protein